MLPDLLGVVREVPRAGGSTKHSFEMKVKFVKPVSLLMTQISNSFLDKMKSRNDVYSLNL